MLHRCEQIGAHTTHATDTRPEQAIVEPKLSAAHSREDVTDCDEHTHFCDLHTPSIGSLLVSFYRHSYKQQG